MTLFAVCALALLGAGAVASAAPAGGPDPTVAKWPQWPHEVACLGGTPIDPTAAFSGPTDAERGTEPSEKALRRYLQSGELDWVPRHHWRLLFEDATHAEFATGRLEEGLQTMHFERIGGAWKWQGYTGGCEPRTIRDDELAITWTLADGQRLTPQTRVIEVNLGAGECNGGKPQRNRLEKPEFREQRGALLMTLWLRPVPAKGAHTCLGAIEPPVKIRLPAPLGDRLLMDGGTYPPRFPNAGEHIEG